METITGTKNGEEEDIGAGAYKQVNVSLQKF